MRKSQTAAISFRVCSRHWRDGCVFGAHFLKKACCLLALPKQMSFLTISNKKIFFQNSRHQIGCDSRIQKRSRIGSAFTFLYGKSYILLENIFVKVQFILLHLHYSFFTLQVIGNAAIKHQRPYRYILVLQPRYFDPNYLAIDQVFIENILLVSVLRILLIFKFLSFTTASLKKI